MNSLKIKKAMVLDDFKNLPKWTNFAQTLHATVESKKHSKQSYKKIYFSLYKGGYFLKFSK